MSCSPKEWSDAQHALEYLNLADSLPHRSEGDSVLEDLLAGNTKRILDLGTADGRLIRMIMAKRPDIEAVALDVSPTMLESARDLLPTIKGLLLLHMILVNLILIWLF